MDLIKLSAIKNINNPINLDFSKIKWLKHKLLYENTYYNRYDIKIYKPFVEIPLEERKDKLFLELGNIIFINDFPFKDKNEDKPFYRKHYFMYLGHDIKNKKVFLAYITTKTERFQKRNIRNNNYILIRDISKNKKILISFKKVYEIDRNWLLKQFHLKYAFVNKKINPLLMPYIKRMIKQSEHFSNHFKNNTKKYLLINREKYEYPLKVSEEKKRSKREKEKFVQIIKTGKFEKFINLFSNY